MMFKKLIACATAAVIVAASLSGCGTEEQKGEVSNCVVVCSQRQNSSAGSAAAQPEVESTVKTGGYFDIVRADGNPTSAIGSGTSLTVDGGNDDNRDKNEKILLYQVLDAMRNVKAETPEVDIAAAFEYANRSLASAPQDGVNTVVVCDSGVSTAGVIDFTSGDLVSAEAESFISYLESSGQLTTFGNIDRVIWYGFGDVSGSQEEMSQAAKANMQAIYKAYLEAAGVSEVTFADEVSQANDASSELPSVSAVDMPSVPTFKGAGSTVKLDQAQLSFVGDKADFLDEDAAREVLEQYAEALAFSPNLTAFVRGYTASYPSDPSWPVELSAMRAEKVRDVLVELGADTGQVAASGEGVGPVADLDETGRQIEALARQNRYVEISFE